MYMTSQVERLRSLWIAQKWRKSMPERNCTCMFPPRQPVSKGTFTYTSVKAGTESLVKELPSAYTYVENGLNQYAATAKSKSAGRR